jgi:hypothetical protein
MPRGILASHGPTGRWLSTLPLLAAMLLAAGCRSRSDVVEAELRSRENQVYELRNELDRSEAYNAAMERELHGLRQGGPLCPSPEAASLTYTVKEVVLGRQTGGYNDDNCVGDQAVQIVLEPRDPDGHAIKAPGRLHVDALEINQQGLKRPISAWDISPDELRRNWRNGLLTTGYYLVLPWRGWPTSPKVRLIAHFTLADGRVFEADRDITIRLPATTSPVPRTFIEDAPTPRPIEGPAPVQQAVPVPDPIEPAGLSKPPTKPSAAPKPQRGPDLPSVDKKPKTDTTSLRPAELLPPRAPREIATSR